MKPTTEVEGIVLSVQDYRESDGIIRLLTQDKILSILARGIQKQTSKNRMITAVFSHVRYTIEQKENGLSLLYYGNVIDSHYKIMEDLMKSSICFVLAEVITRFHGNPTIYMLFDKCLKEFQNDDAKAYNYACLLLAQIIQKRELLHLWMAVSYVKEKIIRNFVCNRWWFFMYHMQSWSYLT